MGQPDRQNSDNSVVRGNRSMKFLGTRLILTPFVSYNNIEERLTNNRSEEVR
jgi:hypothetical protein